MSFSGIAGAKDTLGPFREFQFKEPEPTLNEDLSNVIVIDNLPKAPVSKAPLLTKVIIKVLTKKLRLEISPDDVYLAKDEKTTRGVAFIEFDSPEKAEHVKRAMDHFKFDASHTLRVNLVSDFNKIEERLEELQREYKAPPLVERDNLLSWLDDPERRDQYVTREENDVAVFWMDPLSGPKENYRRAEWSEQVIQWSPHGRFLATFHQQGIALWGGKDWSSQGRFEHPHVLFIDFSPRENFLITWSKEEGTVIFWDVRAMKPLKLLRNVFDIPWPLFKWSHDEKYVARMVNEGILIVETATMQPLSEEPIPVPNICNFAWSPSDNILSYWSKETEDRPARVALLAIPSMNEVRQVDFFQVTNLEMYWQDAGDFLGIKVERIQDKVTQISYEVFHMRDRGVPVSSVPVEGAAFSFSWEPRGPRFSIIHGDKFSPTVSFHSLKSAQNGKLQQVKQIEMRGADRVLYSGYKGYAVVLAMGQGQLEFWDTETRTFLAERQHIMMTDAAWDPSGRFLASWVSRYQHHHENGYKLWNIFGREMESKKMDRFWQFAWRPRPNLLTAGDEKWLKKNLKREEKKLEKKIMAVVSEQNAGEREKRQRKLEEWNQIRQRLRQELEKTHQQRQELGVVFDSDDDFEVIEDVQEEPIGNAKETVVKQ